MHLAPREIDKILLHNAGVIAQKRYARGLALNYPETVALLSALLLEFIRDGDTVAQLMAKGKGILGFEDVMPGVPDMLHEVQVEGTFPDGTKLVTIHFPVCRMAGDEDLALYSSGLVRDKKPELNRTAAGSMAETASGEVMKTSPGQKFCMEGSIVLNENRDVLSVEVLNTGDRPVQVGSHYPFFETNPSLKFDRKASFGMRLDIPAGTAVRFEPGEKKTVQLVAIAGARKIFGGNGFINGKANVGDMDAAVAALERSGIIQE